MFRAFVAVFLLTTPCVLFAQTNPVTPPRPIASPAPSIDPAAMAVLKKSQDVMFALKTFRAEAYTKEKNRVNADFDRPIPYSIATITAMKPNKVRYEEWRVVRPTKSENIADWQKDESDFATTVCDGKTEFRELGKTYNAEIADDYISFADCPNFVDVWHGFFAESLSPFDSVNSWKKNGYLLEVCLDGEKMVGRVLCDVVRYRVRYTATDNLENTTDTTLYIGRDGIIRRENTTARSEDKLYYERDTIVRNIRLNVPILRPGKVFHYTPTADVLSQAERNRLSEAERNKKRLETTDVTEPK